MLQPSWVRHGRMVLGSKWRPFQQQPQAYLLAHLPDMSAPACCPQVWWQCSPVSRHVTEAAVNTCAWHAHASRARKVSSWNLLFFYLKCLQELLGDFTIFPFQLWCMEITLHLLLSQTENENKVPYKKKGSLHSNTSSRATITIPRQVSKEQNTRHRRETDYAMSALLRFVHPPQMVLVAVRDRMLGWRELSVFQSDNFYIPKTTR